MAIYPKDSHECNSLPKEGYTKPTTPQNVYSYMFKALAGLHRHILDFGCLPPPAQFSSFHAVFRKIWSNNSLALTPLGSASLCEILDPPM